MAAILATEPGDECCKNPGFIHSGDPKGETLSLGGLQTYVAYPPKPTNRVILVFPDVHGPFHINNQLLFDYFASQGANRCFKPIFIQLYKTVFFT